MPTLVNPRHERFAQELAKGKTADESYPIAGFKENRHNAAALAREEHIKARVAELLAEREQMHAQSTAQAIQKVALTKAWVLDELIDNALIANGKKTVKLKVRPRGQDLPIDIEVTQRDSAAANRALELLGKELGMFVERKEVGQPGDFASMNDDELLARIKDRAVALGITVPKTLHS